MLKHSVDEMLGLRMEGPPETVEVYPMDADGKAPG